MPDKPESPKAQRGSIIVELRVMERLIDRLLKRARTHAGPGKVGDRLEEILLVNGSLKGLTDRLEAIDASEG